MRTRNYITHILLVLTLLSFNNCSDDYLERLPLDEPSDATFWSTETELQMSVNAIYRSLYATDRDVTHVPFQFLLDLGTDISWDRNLSSWQLLSKGLITPNDVPLITGMWNTAYETIGKCNRLITYMERAKDNTDPAVYANIETEARFFRAYWYHLLTNLYGDVPFTTEPLDI